MRDEGIARGIVASNAATHHLSDSSGLEMAGTSTWNVITQRICAAICTSICIHTLSEGQLGENGPEKSEGPRVQLDGLLSATSLRDIVRDSYDELIHIPPPLGGQPCQARHRLPHAARRSVPATASHCSPVCTPRSRKRNRTGTHRATASRVAT